MLADVYLAGGVRTPIGGFAGALASVSAPALGSTAIRAALERAGVEAERVDEVIFGNVLFVIQHTLAQSQINRRLANPMMSFKYLQRRSFLCYRLLGTFPARMLSLAQRRLSNNQGVYWRYECFLKSTKSNVMANYPPFAEHIIQRVR